MSLSDPKRLAKEEEARDQALALLGEHRTDVIEAAFVVAVCIAKVKGTVSSSDVLTMFRQSLHWQGIIGDKDPRFMGPVFRRKVWEAVGWEPTGSHKRPVRVWKLRG